MRKIPVIVGLVASLVILFGRAPTSSAQDAPLSSAEKVATRGVVFQVEGKDGGEIWLAGSVHMLRANDYPLPVTYEEAYGLANQIVFEIPPSELQSPEAMAIIQRSILYPDGTTLKDHLSSENYEKVVTFLKTSGMAMEQVQMLKPWMLGQLIGLQEFTKQGFKPELGLDLYFETKAAKDKKQVKGLETVEFQMGLFGNLPASQQEELLVSSLDDFDDAKEFITSLMSAWKSGDTEKVAEVMNEGMEDDPALAKALLLDRNVNWVKPIEEFLKSKTPTLVIVGAGHLCGKGSVVELLQKNGHKVTQH
ncbi:MAG: TraB/GumN family protein [Verrucomicrobiae bacterium]|nr:TraB/GumN family protein [Verrucomicrobiae bacterium]